MAERLTVSIYLNSQIVPSEDGLSSKQVRVRVDAEVDAATGTVVVGDVHLVDEPEGDDGAEKPLKSQTVAELAQKAKDLGVKPDVADHLKKAELIDVIERMTHTNDD